jgi:membrane protein implicated in regulation of membrane protease activity
MESYVLLLIVAIALLAAEMLTGTFYLLMIAIGVACGGIAGWLGASLDVQLLTSSILGAAAPLVFHQWRKRSGAAHKPDRPLDVGEIVQVETWNADGSARVHHRGTQWDAELEKAGTPRDAILYITAMRGSTLILSDRKPQ